MLAIPIHRINNLELRVESITNDHNFLHLHVNRWTSSETCHTIAVIKGLNTASFLVDRAFEPSISPSEFHQLLQIGFKFLSDVPQHIPLYTHLQYLYPEYFI